MSQDGRPTSRRSNLTDLTRRLKRLIKEQIEISTKKQRTHEAGRDLTHRLHLLHTESNTISDKIDFIVHKENFIITNGIKEQTTSIGTCIST